MKMCAEHSNESYTKAQKILKNNFIPKFFIGRKGKKLITRMAPYFRRSGRHSWIQYIDPVYRIE